MSLLEWDLDKQIAIGPAMFTEKLMTNGKSSCLIVINLSVAPSPIGIKFGKPHKEEGIYFEQFRFFVSEPNWGGHLFWAISFLSSNLIVELRDNKAWCRWDCVTAPPSSAWHCPLWPRCTREDFPGGHPSWYWSRLSTLNFGDLMWSRGLTALKRVMSI